MQMWWYKEVCCSKTTADHPKQLVSRMQGAASTCWMLHILDHCAIDNLGTSLVLSRADHRFRVSPPTVMSTTYASFTTNEIPK